MTDVNLHFTHVSEAEILQIQDEAVPQNTKKATKYGLKVFKGKRRLQCVKKCLGFYFADNCQ